ncbi:MAG TPA: hypothetical protein DDX98_02575, partial [Bacteroidales bacterium]|nr:hypothetical protein [Bacteroidales bacterium]
AGGAVAAAGSIVVTGPATEAGTLYIYISGELVTVPVASADSATVIGDAIESAINSDINLAVTASNAAGTVTVTCKAKGTYGNFITIESNLGFGEETPAGVSLALTDLTGGATDPDIDDALTGTNLNQEWFTGLAHAYSGIAANLDKLSVYNGIGNTQTGLYDNLVFRPFQSAIGDVTAGSGGFTAIKALADARKTDRTNGAVSVPGSPNHPAEIAAEYLAIVETLGASDSGSGVSDTVGQILVDVLPGSTADRWTDDYDSRDAAVKFGSAPTIYEDGVVKLQNAVTFYHPDSVADENNGYRFRANISKVWNIGNAFKVNFSQDRWKGVVIVADVSLAADNDKARDVDAVIADLVALTNSFESFGWIFQGEYSKDNLTVTLRVTGTGFDTDYPVILSGVGGIMNSQILFDTSFAALLA